MKKRTVKNWVVEQTHAPYIIMYLYDGCNWVSNRSIDCAFVFLQR